MAVRRRPEAATEGSVAERAKALAAEIELDHDVPVELVVVGDHPGNEALAPSSVPCGRRP